MHDRSSGRLVACKPARKVKDMHSGNDECGLCGGKIIWNMNLLSLKGVSVCEPCYDKFQAIAGDSVKTSLENIMFGNVI